MVEFGLRYERYLQKVLNFCSSISNWPFFDGEQKPFIYSNYSPFDVTPGYIHECIDEYPPWALSFREKGLKPDNIKCVKIELDPEPYLDLQIFTNIMDAKCIQWDTDITLGDFLGEGNSKVFLEREIIELGDNWPKILVERIVAIASDGQETVWGLGVIREFADFENIESEELSNFHQVLHIFGVERLSEHEYGIEQNWYREWEFNHEIDDELLNYPAPLFLASSPFVGEITKRPL
jgi:hypothetical protein